MFEDMSIEEISEYLIRRGQEKDAIRAEMRAAKQVLDRKIAERDASLTSAKIDIKTSKANGRNE